jgi:hypothetical protein
LFFFFLIRDKLLVTMIVTVALLGNLNIYSRPGTPGQWEGEIPEGSLLRDLARRVGIPEGAFGMATVNGALRGFDTPVPEPGARILFFSPMSGG